MAIMRRLLAGTAGLLLAGGLATVTAAPAEAAWRTTYIGSYATEPPCEADRASAEQSIPPSEGGVGGSCRYYGYDPAGRGRGAGWYFLFLYNNN